MRQVKRTIRRAAPWGRVLCALAAAAALAPAPAWGQGRGALELSTPQIGRSRALGPSGDLMDHSYGLGGLQRPAPAGGDLLRSNINAAAGTQIRRTAAGLSTGAPDSRLGAMSTPLGGALGSPLGSPLGTAAGGLTIPRGSLSQSLSGTGRTGGLAMLDALAGAAERAGEEPPPPVTPAPFLLAFVWTGVNVERTVGTLDVGAEAPDAPYLAAAGGSARLAMQGRSVTGLVPTEPSLYQAHAARGDLYFRNGHYDQAASAFAVAASLAQHTPESRLNQAHAAFAAARYHEAADHICQALQLLPELGLARLQVRGFYGRNEDFDAHLKALLERIGQRDLPEPDLLLVLGYVYYFNDQPALAAEALREARTLTKDARLRETLSTFWEGMLVAGKVTGTLLPTVLTAPAAVAPQPPGGAAPAPGPEPTSRPASPWPADLERAGTP